MLLGVIYTVLLCSRISFGQPRTALIFLNEMCYKSRVTVQRRRYFIGITFDIPGYIKEDTLKEWLTRGAAKKKVHCIGFDGCPSKGRCTIEFDGWPFKGRCTIGFNGRPKEGAPYWVRWVAVQRKVHCIGFDGWPFKGRCTVLGSMGGRSKESALYCCLCFFFASWHPVF